MKKTMILIISLSVTSCASISGYGGNPKPNMKSIHMGFNHSGYTAEDYQEHADRDCNGAYTLIKDRS